MDISDTLAPDSAQLDAVDLLGGEQTFRIEKVSKGPADQPVQIHLADFPRPWRPGKSMRRVLVACWGPDASVYVGRSVTLFCDNTVVFGGAAVGGTRIRALSHIDEPKKVPLLISKGRSAMFTVQPLTDSPKTTPPPTDPTAAMVARYATLNVTRQQLEAHVALAMDEWTPETLEKLRVLGGEIASGTKSVGDVFGEAS